MAPTARPTPWRSPARCSSSRRWCSTSWVTRWWPGAAASPSRRSASSSSAASRSSGARAARRARSSRSRSPGPLVTLGVVGLCVGLGMLAGGGLGVLGRRDAWAPTAGSPPPCCCSAGWPTSTRSCSSSTSCPPSRWTAGASRARSPGSSAATATGPRRVASAMGVGFSYLLIGLGLFALVQGSVGAGIWFIFLGLFLGGAARSESARSAFLTQIGGVTVADIMDREPVAMPADLKVGPALEEFVLRYRWPWFPVTDARGPLPGDRPGRARGGGRARRRPRRDGARPHRARRRRLASPRDRLPGDAHPLRAPPAPGRADGGGRRGDVAWGRDRGPGAAGAQEAVAH